MNDETGENPSPSSFLKNSIKTFIVLILFAVISACGYFIYRQFSDSSGTASNKTVSGINRNMGSQRRFNPAGGAVRNQNASPPGNGQQAPARAGAQRTTARQNRTPTDFYKGSDFIVPDRRRKYLQDRIFTESFGKEYLSKEKEILQSQITELAVHNAKRIAILPIGTKDTEILRIVAELGTSLSSDPNLVLLEREQINKILGEHELNLSVISNQVSRIQLGRLLKADILVLLEPNAAPTGGKSKDSFLAVRNVESSTGIVLTSYASFSPEKDPAGLEKAVRLAIQKTDRKAGKRYFLGFTGFSPADVEKEGGLRGFCNALGMLVLNDLGQYPDIVVLERKDMKSLAEENKLTGKEASFQTSELFLGGEISLNFDGKLIVDASLKTTAGTKLKAFKITGDRDDISGFRRQLVEQIGGELQSKSPSLRPFDPKYEAKVFWKEAYCRMYTRNIDQSSGLADAALALDDSPGNRELAAVFWKELCYRYHLWMKDKQSYEIAESICTILDVAVRQFGMYCELRRTSDPFETHEFLKAVSDEFEPKIGNISMGDEKSCQIWYELEKLHVREYGKFISEISKEKDAEKVRTMVMELGHLVPWAKFWTEDPEEWDSMLKKAFDILNEKASDDDIGLRMSRSWAYQTFHLFGDFRFSTYLQMKKPGAEAVQHRYLNEALKHADPMVQLAGCDFFQHSGAGSRNGEYSKKYLDIYAKNFPPGHSFNFNCYTTFPERGIESALDRIVDTSSFSDADGYFEKVIGPMMKDEYAYILVYYENFLEKWAKLLADNEKYEKAEGLVTRGKEMLNAFISKKSLPDGLKEFVKRNDPDMSAGSMDYYFRERARESLSSLSKLEEAVTVKSGKANYKDPPVPEGLSEYEIRLSPARNIFPSALRSSYYTYYDTKDYNSCHPAYFTHNRQFDVLRACTRPGNRQVFYLHRISPDSGNIRTDRAEVLYMPDTKIFPQRSVSGNYVWIFNLTGGLILFDASGARVFTVRDGLPTNVTNVFAALNGKVYLGTGKSEMENRPGSLSEFDPATMKVKTICSNASGEKHSLLDGGEPYSVLSVVADEKNSCIWINVKPNRPDDASKLPAFWKYDPQSQRLEEVAALPKRDVLAGLERYELKGSRRFVKYVNFIGQYEDSAIFRWGAIPPKKTKLEKFKNEMVFTIVPEVSYNKVWQIRPKLNNALAEGWEEAIDGFKGMSTGGLGHMQDAYSYMDSCIRDWSEKDYGIAMENFAGALKMLPRDNDEICLDIAFAHYNLKQYDDAIEYATKAIQLRADFLDAYFLRSGSYAAKGDFERAYADIRKAREIGPIDHVIEEKQQWIEWQIEMQNKGSVTAKQSSLKPENLQFPKLSESDRKKVLLLLKGLGDADPRVRLGAATNLRPYAQSLAPALPILLSAVDDSATKVRVAAIDVLGLMGTDAKDALPKLLPLMAGQEIIRCATVKSIANIAPQDGRVLDALIKQIDAPEEPVMGYAIAGLGIIGPSAKKSLPLIRERMKYMNEWDKINAIRSLAKIEGSYDSIVAEYLKQLSGEEALARRTALTSLEKLGLNLRDYGNVVDAIRRLSKEDDDPEIRASARDILSRMK
ncbi:MAG TPA: hypothetical protein DCZ94_18350 [Lentisphaeria bacterium]|nr:MAG: hypothetical protein A2X48_22835 [Lentisphaerae bacterium GWF2_49_21]HBC88908.1 hypothetical protein [Lentisphaeria bacterium]